MVCTPARCACLYGLSPFPSVLRISPISTLLIWRLYCLSKMAFRSANNWKQNKENEIEKNVSLILRSTKNSLLVCVLFFFVECVCVCVRGCFHLICLPFRCVYVLGKDIASIWRTFPAHPTAIVEPGTMQFLLFFLLYRRETFSCIRRLCSYRKSLLKNQLMDMCVWYIYSMYLPGLLAHLVNNLRCAQQYSRHVNKWKCEWECDISIRPTWHPLDTPQQSVNGMSNKIFEECFRSRVSAGRMDRILTEVFAYIVGSNSF